MTTIQKWQMLVLTAAVFYGSGLVASMVATEKQQPSNPIEIVLSQSAEKRRRLQEAEEAKVYEARNRYCAYPGSNSPDGYYVHCPRHLAASDATKPYYWFH